MSWLTDPTQRVLAGALTGLSTRQELIGADLAVEQISDYLDEPDTVLPVLCWAWAGTAAARSTPSATTHPCVRQRLIGVLLELSVGPVRLRGTQSYTTGRPGVATIQGPG